MYKSIYIPKDQGRTAQVARKLSELSFLDNSLHI